MKYYPVYLDMRGRSCLVIGGGSVAERKTITLLEAGADVTIVSPTLTSKLQELSQSGKITHRKKDFEEKDLSSEFLVIAATDSPELNNSAAMSCKKKHILVNVVVPPDESSFIVPSVVERGDLLIAVSTGGISPALAKKIRQELEAHYGVEYTLFLEKLAKVRKRVLDEVPDEQKRRSIFQAIVDSDVIDLLKQGRTHEADVRIAEISRLKHFDG
ncbi:MAG TPA: bifunctional precorrin-2 dehydrogenase/sirohydrochlorin ferrochelatase [Nitrospirota bacterium]|nr:bifunctional precorrin-2 dehydrogenase/sirohydrochlorin ferrochelatase [Nitrospirota bacterium]